jgi:hypothetical protein
VSARTALVTGFRLSLAGRSPARSAGMTGTNVAALPVCIPYLSLEYRLVFSVRTPPIIPRSPHERSDMRELRTARREPGYRFLIRATVRRRSLACSILPLRQPGVEGSEIRKIPRQCNGTQVRKGILASYAEASRSPGGHRTGFFFRRPQVFLRRGDACVALFGSDACRQRGEECLTPTKMARLR